MTLLIVIMLTFSGISQTILRSLEAGTNHADMTLGLLQRLAQILDPSVGRSPLGDDRS